MCRTEVITNPPVGCGVVSGWLPGIVSELAKDVVDSFGVFAGDGERSPGCSDSLLSVPIQLVVG